MGDESFEGTWAVVSEGATKYVGRIIEPTGAADELRRAPRFIMKPTFELVTPILPSPQGLQRMPTVLPVGATTEPVPVSVTNGSVYFFEEMSDADVAAYRNMIKDCEKASVAARAKRSGLVMPKEDGRA